MAEDVAWKEMRQAEELEEREGYSLVPPSFRSPSPVGRWGGSVRGIIASGQRISTLQRGWIVTDP